MASLCCHSCFSAKRVASDWRGGGSSKSNYTCLPDYILAYWQVLDSITVEIVDVCILLVRVGFRTNEFMDEFGSDSDTDCYLNDIRDSHVEAECGENDSVNSPCGIILKKTNYSDVEGF
jgi:hypothetical protein